jgi:peptidylprolyl isomerase domain and WD repeat-containing protein 1
MYERSFMHRDAVTHAACAQASGTAITASADGVVKFWRRPVGRAGAAGAASHKGAAAAANNPPPHQGPLEFAKAFRAHLAPVCCLAVSPDGALAASLARDRTLKVFDVAALDLVAMARLPFVPGCAAWAFGGGGGGSSAALLAVSDLHSGDVAVYDARGGLVDGGGGGQNANDDDYDDGSGAVPLSRAAAAATTTTTTPSTTTPTPLQTLRNLHQAPVTAMAYNPAADAMITADAKGYIEYWSPSAKGLPALPLPAGASTTTTTTATLTASFSLKLDTDLYCLARLGTRARSLCVSPDGRQFAAVCADGRVRVWRWASGALRRAYDESSNACRAWQRRAGEKAAEAAAEAEAGGNSTPTNSYLDPSSPLSPLDDLDFGRRLAVERELSAALAARDRADDASASAADPAAAAVEASRAHLALTPTATFDDSGHFLIYGTMLGVKVVNLETNACARLLGKVENTERFVSAALLLASGVGGGGAGGGGGGGGAGGVGGLATSAVLRVNPDALPPVGGGGRGNGNDNSTTTNTNTSLNGPVLVACAFRRQRLYLFSRREPADGDGGGVGRDVFNEKPTADELLAGGGGGGAAGVGGAAAAAGAANASASGLPSAAILRTTKGDVRLRLYPDECPRTVENFATHARNGYYDGVLFHRGAFFLFCCWLALLGGFLDALPPLPSRRFFSRDHSPPSPPPPPFFPQRNPPPTKTPLSFTQSSKASCCRRATPWATARAARACGAASSRTSSRRRCGTTARARCRWPTAGPTPTAPSSLSLFRG